MGAFDDVTETVDLHSIDSRNSNSGWYTFPFTKLMIEYSMDFNPTVSQVWLSDEARAIATGNSVHTQSNK
jgi:hypothetical protein